MGRAGFLWGAINTLCACVSKAGSMRRGMSVRPCASAAFGSGRWFSPPPAFCALAGLGKCVWTAHLFDG